MTTAAPSRRLNSDLRSDILVLVVAAVALLVAFLYENSRAAQTTLVTDTQSGLTLNIPSNWTVNSPVVAATPDPNVTTPVEPTPDPEVFISAYDTRADSVFKSTITGRSFALDTEKPADLDTIVDGLVDQRQKDLMAFHLIGTETVTLGGSEGRALHYAYVTQPIDEAFSDSPPVVVVATDYVVYSPGKEYWVLSAASDEKIADLEQGDFDTILKSIKIP